MKQQPLESTISNGIIKAINKIDGCLVHKFHGTAFGHKEVDIYGCCRGRAVFIETKRDGNPPTQIQEAIMEKWKSCGALTGVAHNVSEAMDIIAPALGGGNA